MRFPSRSLLAVGAAIFMSSLTFSGLTDARAEAAKKPVALDGLKKHHAMSLTGEPKEPADFKHFSWVNPDAPKGGTLRQAVIGKFDSLNIFTPKGNRAAPVGLTFDSLMATSLDEGSTEYGLIAEWAAYPKDYSSVTFKLRKEARFHDGKPITADDVIYSLAALKKAHPFFRLYYKDVERVEKLNDHLVTFHFASTGNRELPHIIGQLDVLPKHWWEAKKADGSARDISKTTLEPMLGSGPYKISQVRPGEMLKLERVDDYWAKDLPVRRGMFNFDTLEYEYFRERTAAFEAFKAGDIHFWSENSAKEWATAYNFPALRKGDVVKTTLQLEGPQPMQGFVLNLRRDKFADRRVREALNLAFNFEQANRDLFFNQYTRTNSYFVGAGLGAEGLPEGRELEILNAYKDKLPAEVFTAEFKNPENADRRAFRRNMRKARKLLKEAGFTVERGVLKDKNGAPFTMEFMIRSPAFKRVVLPYVSDLKKLGITATVAMEDDSSYTRRVQDFNFDVIVGGFAQSESPGNEQREYWGSNAAKMKGSRNTIGISDPVIDSLIEKIIFATSREELVATTKALDRVLLWNHFIVPQWYVPYERVAYWDRFGRPKPMPSRAVGLVAVWWQENGAVKEAKTQN